MRARGPVATTSPSREQPFLEKNVEEKRKTVKEFLEDFEKTLKVAWGLAESTIVQRMRTAERLVDFLDGHPLTASRSDILDFLEKYDVHGSYKGVRVIYGRFFDTNLADDIKIPRSDPAPRRIPSKEVLRETFYKLSDLEYKTAFLMLASSGLRRGELMGLSEEDVDFDKRMLMPRGRSSKSTKRSWVSFYNEEAESYLEKLGRLPNQKYIDSYTREFREVSDCEISPQTLRKWFAEEMGKLGVSDRYIDAFCGRVPKSVLANHYTDFSPSKLKEIYEEANLKVL